MRAYGETTVIKINDKDCRKGVVSRLFCLLASNSPLLHVRVRQAIALLLHIHYSGTKQVHVERVLGVAVTGSGAMVPSYNKLNKVLGGTLPGRTNIERSKCTVCTTDATY